MSPEYAIIGVEGYHDQAFVGRILKKILGLEEFKGKKKDLDLFWEKFIPSYPKGGNLYSRLDMPRIFYSSTHSVAIYAGGGSKFIRNINDTLKAHEPYRTEISAFGIVVDADENNISEKAGKIQDDMKENFPEFPDKPGIVSGTSLRLGVYFLPDNASEGTLDHLLLRLAEESYPVHKERAVEYISKFKPSETTHWHPFDREKATVAAIASVLKPGGTNTVSIKEDEWVSQKTLTVPELNRFVEFLRDLLELRTENTSSS